jgi:hypothetical protein
MELQYELAVDGRPRHRKVGRSVLGVSQ